MADSLPAHRKPPAAQEAAYPPGAVILASANPSQNAVVRWIRVCAAAVAYLGFAVGSVLTSLVVPIVWLTSFNRSTRRRRCLRVVGTAFRFFHGYMQFTGLVRLITGHGELDGPYVVVANHPSLVDYTAIAATLPELCCVVKRSLFYNPILTILMRCCGHLSASTTAASREATITGAVERLRDGMSVLIFPEGTRTSGAGVDPFERLAFDISEIAGIPILPIAVRVDKPLLRKSQPWYDIPLSCATLSIERLEPLTASNGARCLKKCVHKRLAAHLGVEDVRKA